MPVAVARQPYSVVDTSRRLAHTLLMPAAELACTMPRAPCFLGHAHAEVAATLSFSAHSPHIRIPPPSPPRRVSSQAFYKSSRTQNARTAQSPQLAGECFGELHFAYTRYAIEHLPPPATSYASARGSLQRLSFEMSRPNLILACIIDSRHWPISPELFQMTSRHAGDFPIFKFLARKHKKASLLSILQNALILPLSCLASGASWHSVVTTTTSRYLSRQALPSGARSASPGGYWRASLVKDAAARADGYASASFAKYMRAR